MTSTRSAVLFLFALLPLAPAGGGLWDDLKQGTSRAVEKGKAAVGEAANATSEVAGKVAAEGKAVITDTREHFHREGEPEALRAQSDALAYAAMDRLFVDDPEAHVLFDRCFGYAVFEMRQVSFGVTAGYGYGVARERESAIPTYMKMATGGAGYSLGLGGFAFQLVLLFEDQPTYLRFLEQGIEGRAEASSMVGEETDYLAKEFRQGLVAYKLTKQGFKVSAGLIGMRFWIDEDLSQPNPLAASAETPRNPEPEERSDASGAQAGAPSVDAPPADDPK